MTSSRFCSEDTPLEHRQDTKQRTRQSKNECAWNVPPERRANLDRNDDQELQRPPMVDTGARSSHERAGHALPRHISTSWNALEGSHQVASPSPLHKETGPAGTLRLPSDEVRYRVSTPSTFRCRQVVSEEARRTRATAWFHSVYVPPGKDGTTRARRPTYPFSMGAHGDHPVSTRAAQVLRRLQSALIELRFLGKQTLCW